jgi:outer membrane biosynthesis protein TonB
VRKKEPVLTQVKDWRLHLSVHPAADDYPLMAEYAPDALKALAEDIRKNGIEVRPATTQGGWTGNPVQLLDGRNRLDAAALAALLYVSDEDKLYLATTECPEGGEVDFFEIEFDLKPGDPYETVQSLNVHRRHLNTKQKRNLIKARLKAHPELSDREIGRRTQTDHKTVAEVRRELEATGEIPQLTETEGKDGKARRKRTKPPEPAVSEPKPEPKPPRPITSKLPEPAPEPKPEPAAPEPKFEPAEPVVVKSAAPSAASPAISTEDFPKDGSIPTFLLRNSLAAVAIPAAASRALRTSYPPSTLKRSCSI